MPMGDISSIKSNENKYINRYFSVFISFIAVTYKFNQNLYLYMDFVNN